MLCRGRDVVVVVFSSCCAGCGSEDSTRLLIRSHCRRLTCGEGVPLEMSACIPSCQLHILLQAPPSAVFCGRTGASPFCSTACAGCLPCPVMAHDGQRTEPSCAAVVCTCIVKPQRHNLSWSASGFCLCCFPHSPPLAAGPWAAVNRACSCTELLWAASAADADGSARALMLHTTHSVLHAETERIDTCIVIAMYVCAPTGGLGVLLGGTATVEAATEQGLEAANANGGADVQAAADGSCRWGWDARQVSTQGMQTARHSPHGCCGAGAADATMGQGCTCLLCLCACQ